MSSVKSLAPKAWDPMTQSYILNHSINLFLSLCIPAVLPAWRGAAGGHGWGWAQCVRWESGEESSSQGLECPLWCVLCRGGRDRLKQACQRGRGALRLPADMLSLKLPQLFDIHQVPKVSAWLISSSNCRSTMLPWMWGVHSSPEIKMFGLFTMNNIKYHCFLCHDVIAFSQETEKKTMLSMSCPI